LDDQAYYLATKANPAVGHRFLVAAHDTFALLATQPEMGWRSRLDRTELKSLRVFRVSGFGRMLILYRPQQAGVEILRVVHSSRNLNLLLRREGLE
jgi:toxin ParE1/3/4